jgi:hypothetical protein
MQKRNSVQSGLFNPRVLAAFSLCCVGLLLAMFSLSATPSKKTTSSSTKIGSQSKSALTPSAPASMTGPTTNFSNGITFDHATWNDPIRMVGEPDIEIDNHGGVYVSGPGGTPTQTSWFWKSTDNGLQWHIIGCPDKSNCQNGGGDTEIAFGRNRDVFGSDLQTLQCNSTFRSFDEGQTFIPGEGCFPETDRQWMGVYDPNSSATGRRIYLAANGQGQGCYCLVSTDNGVTYQPPDPVNNPTAAIDLSNLISQPGCIGRFAVDPANGNIFVPTDRGTYVSTDGAVTWHLRGNNGAQGNFFAPIQIDTAGNLWQAWTDLNKAFLSYSTDHAVTWSAPIQVSTGPGSPVGTSPDLRQMIFPWLAVGDPGRVAIVFYGTTDTQNDTSIPSIGGPNALWHVYASFSTNAMAANPTFTQVQADEHAMHRGAVCLGGFPGCLEANSDRSMADFFMVDKDPHGRVFISYNENSDLSDVSQGAGQEYIGKPINAVIRLRTGPSLFSTQGNLLPLPTPANVAITSATASSGTLSVAGTQGLPPGNWTTDPAGDAPFPVIPVTSANHPALDILEVSASDDGTNLTFKLKMADLSATALADAATAGGTPTWMVTWWEGKNGIGPSGVTSGPFHSHWFVKCLNATATAPQFVYGKDSSIDFAALGAPTPKFLTYVPAGAATGNVTGNVITITVPLANVGPIVAGDKIDHVTAYSLVEHTDPTLNDWADQVKSFSYVIGTPAANQHFPDGYVQVSTDNFATSTLATINNTNNTWSASLPAGTSSMVCARQVLAKDLYTQLWDDVQAGPPSCATLTGPTPISLVSRKIHGSAGPFDIALPLTGTPGIEPRGSGPVNNYTLIFTFPANLTGVVGATVTGHNPSNGTGAVNGTSIGPLPNQLTVNLTNVTTGQYLVVTLTGVSDVAGNSGNVISPSIGILVGDVDMSGRVDGNDVSAVQTDTRQSANSTNFQFDVDANGRIDGNDVSDTQTQTRTALPLSP